MVFAFSTVATNIFRARVYRDYRLTHPYVTRYVSKTVTLTGISEDLDRLHDCVALCTIQWNGEDRFCHFAYIEGDVCHLGHIQADSPFTVVSGLASPVPDNVIRYNRRKYDGHWIIPAYLGMFLFLQSILKALSDKEWTTCCQLEQVMETLFIKMLAKPNTQMNVV